MLLDTTSVGDHAKVLDFGIAKINEPDGEFDGGLTAPNLVIGTPQYMSPSSVRRIPRSIIAPISIRWASFFTRC